MNNPVLILGAGISGLGAAYKLSCNGQQTVVLEKDTTYGGLCGNFTIDGFRFDRFVHFSFAKDEQVNRIVRQILTFLRYKITINGYGFNSVIFLQNVFRFLILRNIG